MSETNIPRPPEPLYDTEAERAVLGALLENCEIMPTVTDALGMNSEAFYKAPHQIIYHSAVELFDKHGKFDASMVAADINQKGLTGRVGGEFELFDIVDATSSWENFEYYTDIVREKYFRRRISDLSKQIAVLSLDTNVDSEGALSARLEELFAGITQARRAEVQTAYEIMGGVIEQITSRTEPRLTMGTGFPALDEMTAGFHEGDMFIIAGRPSMGKTAIAIQMAHHLAYEKGIPVVFYSYEMKKASIIQRLLVRDTGIDYQRLDRQVLTDSEKELLDEAYKTYEGKPLYIFDKGFNIHELASHVRYMKHKHDVKVAFYDYLQLLPADRRYSGDVEKITYFSGRMKAMARDNDICSVPLSQLSRASEKRVGFEPRLSDLRDSGALEQDADGVMFVHRPGMYDNEEDANRTLTKIKLDKNRNGPTGPLYLHFDGRTFTFKEA